MTPERAREVVLLSMLGTGALVVVSEASAGRLPAPRRVLALGITYVGLAGLVSIAPSLGAAFAGVVFVGALVRHGDSVAGGLLAAAESEAPVSSGGARALSTVPPPAAPAPGAAGGQTTAAPAGRPGADARPAGAGRYKPLAASYPRPGPHGAARNAFGTREAADLMVPVGTPAVAVTDGVIGPRIGPLSSDPGSVLAGQRLYLIAPDGTQFYYAHLSRIAVRAGERVRAGQVLGYTGVANNVPHLHFEVSRGSIRDWV